MHLISYFCFLDLVVNYDRDMFLTGVPGGLTDHLELEVSVTHERAVLVLAQAGQVVHQSVILVSQFTRLLARALALLSDALHAVLLFVQLALTQLQLADGV